MTSSSQTIMCLFFFSLVLQMCSVMSRGHAFRFHASQSGVEERKYFTKVDLLANNEHSRSLCSFKRFKTI